MGGWFSFFFGGQQPEEPPPQAPPDPPFSPVPPPVHPQFNNNIAAIDFGTTSVSLAYTTRGDEKVSTLPLDTDKFTRVCNAVLFKKTGNGTKIEAFSKKARTRFITVRPDELENFIYLYFERIKMLLQKDKAINRKTTVESFTGKHYYLVEVIAFILKYLKDLLIDHLSRSATPLKTTDFDWVITVPAIWDARGKRMMREAAYMAGLLTKSSGITSFTPVSARPLPVPQEINPEKLTLALEPEVAALYSQEVVVNKRERNPSAAVLRGRPTHYMVIDIGGGTVDITVHIERDGGIVVESIPTGNAWGGTQVNEAFSKMLQEIINDPKFKRFLPQPTDYKNYAKHTGLLNEILYVKFEEEKLLFGKSKIEREISINLPRKFVDFYDRALKTGVMSMEGVSYDDDILYISKDVVESRLFNPVLDGIVSGIIPAIEKSGCEVNTFYLVGGFGGCQFIYKRVKAAIEEFYRSERYHHRCHVIVPESPDLAVATGAVMWRNNPEIFKERRVDATYGVAVNTLFNPSKHDEHYRFYRDEDKKDMCHSYFQHFIKKGDFAKRDEKITKTFFPNRQTDNEVTVIIYSTSKEGVKYVKDKAGRDTVTKIGQLVLAVPNPYNLPKSQREIEVTMDFSSTEIQAKAKYLVTGKEVKTVCDFLTDQKDL